MSHDNNLNVIISRRGTFGGIGIAKKCILSRSFGLPREIIVRKQTRSSKKIDEFMLNKFARLVMEAFFGDTWQSRLSVGHQPHTYSEEVIGISEDDDDAVVENGQRR